ncbi:hypothetical protein MCERE19_02988 [Spirosomataceae bacterium]|jgi:hypothetical protein
MKNILIQVFIIAFISLNSKAQKTSYEFKVGLREEFVKSNVSSGNIENVSHARPTIGMDIIVNTKGSTVWPFGLFIQNYAGRTLIERSDIGSTLNSNWFLGLSGGMERFFLRNKKINLSMTLNQIIIFVPNSKMQIASNSFPDGVNPERAIKTETVRAFRTLNPVSQIGGKVWLPLRKNKAGIYLGYSYNLGWNPLFEREVNYNIENISSTAKTGYAKFVTNGTGWQTNFGLRMNMP